MPDFDPNDNLANQPPGARSGRAFPTRLLLAAAVLIFGVIQFYLKNPSQTNPVTDQTHHIGLSVPEQIQLGLQAAPEMINEHGGEHPDPALRAKITSLGMKLVEANTKGDWAGQFQQYHWQFHLLKDAETINAFALPGGQVFFTYGLYKNLKTEDEVAGVIGHEIGHVIAQHSAQQMAKAGLINSAAQAVQVASSDQNHDGTQMARMVQAALSTKYSRGDETQADQLGVQFLINAGYDPQGMISVMEVLEKTASSGRTPEMFATHPNPEHRIDHIRQVIEDVRSGKLQGPK